MHTGSAIHQCTTCSWARTPPAMIATSSGMGRPRPAANSVRKSPAYVKCSMNCWIMAYTDTRVSTSPRRVVLHTESSLGLGGQEIRILTESRWLLEHGWDVVIACQPASRLRAEASAADLSVFSLTMRNAFDVAAAVTLRRLIRQLDIGIVHTHSSVDSWLATLAARSARRPVVRSRHVSIPILRRRAPVYRLADRELMAAVDLLVLPSTRSEATSQVIPQALAVGTPVVATVVGGIPEIVKDGVTGRLVPPGEPDALARAIVEMISDTERAHIMAQAGQALVRERFTVDAMMAATTSVYASLMR